MKETPLLLNKDKEATAAEKKRYHGMTDSIMFSIVEARPNIAYVTSLVSRFAKNALHFYSKAGKTIFHYLKATKNVEITYEEELDGDLTIRGYSDSN